MESIVLGIFFLACSGSSDGSSTPGDVFLPDPDAATFVSAVDNPFFPLPVGATWTFEAETKDGLEHTDIEVLDEAKDIQGVAAIVVKDTLTLDGELAEDTRDWFAQDSEGNVWYLGEDTCEYEDGKCASKEGSWEWGVAGALPGWAFPANPVVDGQPYYQEYKQGEAEDQGEIVAVDESVEIGLDTYESCVKTKDTSAVEPDVVEYKHYCPGIGTVLEEEAGTRVELIAMGGL